MSDLVIDVQPSGGDYTSLVTAVATMMGSYPNLTTDNGSGGPGALTFRIDGDWSSSPDVAASAVSFASFVMSDTCYIRIYTETAARRSSSKTWDTDAYILQNNNISYGGLKMDVATRYVYIDGLQIEAINPGGSARTCFYCNTTATLNTNRVDISNCVFKSHGHASYTTAAFAIASGGGTNAVFNIWNCLSFNNTALVGNRAFSFSGDADSVINVGNCVAIGGEYSFYNSATIAGFTLNARNVYAGGALTSCFYDADIAMSKTTCASSDSSGSGGLTGIAVDTGTFANVTGGSENFHLAGTGSPLYHAGTDTSGLSSPMNFATDIDGDSYYDNGGVRSIGVDEVTGGSPLAVGEYRTTTITMNW